MSNTVPIRADLRAGARTTPPAVLARLFSSQVFLELARTGRSSLLARLLREVAKDSEWVKLTLAEAFDEAYRLLQLSHSRGDYVYRAALTSKLALGTHSLRTAVILNEFRVGTNRADTVLLNGNATVYEIKSERDSLARLSSQIAGYMQVFSRINIVCAPRHAEAVRANTPASVGIITLTRRFTLSRQRAAVSDSSRLSARAISSCLTSPENASILDQFGVKIPSVPNTERRAEYLRAFKSLDIAKLEQAFVKTLKSSRNAAHLRHFLACLPASLAPLALKCRLRPADHTRLLDVLTTPVVDAMSWDKACITPTFAESSSSS